MAQRRPEQPARARHHDPRSADRPAVPEQPDPDQPLQPVRARAVRQRGALSARQRDACRCRTSARTMSVRTRPKRRSNQFDVKTDWNASSRDKIYVRYSRQTHESNPQSTVDAAGLHHQHREPVLERRRELEPHHRHGDRQRPAGRLQRQRLQQLPAGLPRPRQRERQLGIGGGQPIPGLSEVRMGNDLVEHRHARRRRATRPIACSRSTSASPG